MHAKRSRQIDWIALALFASLVIIGWLMIYAAGYDQAEPQSIFSLDTPAGKQALFIGVAIMVAIPVFILETKFWQSFSYIIYAACLVSLLLVLLIGSTIKGSTSWFALGGFSLQPSEFAKFGTCLALASYLSYYKTDLSQIRYQGISLALMLLPAGLILLQPDAGSALVFTSFFLVLYRFGMPGLLYVAGFTLIGLFISALLFPPLLVLAVILLVVAFIGSIQLSRQGLWMGGILALGVAEVLLWNVLSPLPVLILNGALLLITAFRQFTTRQQRHVVLMGAASVISIVFVLTVHFGFEEILEPHQQDRINVWLRPEQCDPRGSLYNVLQSKIAIGSGGVKGKGFLEGSMTNLNYVPEQTTDFIFSTIGEEQGFVGSAGIILLYTLLIIRITAMAERMRTPFNRAYAYGVAGLLFFHFFVNIGMTMGIVPIIGIPLPFISYGGSSLIAFTLLMTVLFKMDAARYRS